MFENNECGETTDFWIMLTKGRFYYLALPVRIKYA
jgi:hypothetical protein